MREEAFRCFLAPRLGARSVDSYLSNLRRVEQLLGADLDVFVSDDTSIDYARARLHDAGLKQARVSDCLSAVRAYAAFRRETAGADLSPRDTVQSGPVDSATRFRTLEQTSTADLLSDYAAILHELRARGVARTGNGPVGDYAEHLFARAMS